MSELAKDIVAALIPRLMRGELAFLAYVDIVDNILSKEMVDGDDMATPLETIDMIMSEDIMEVERPNEKPRPVRCITGSELRIVRRMIHKMYKMIGP